MEHQPAPKIDGIPLPDGYGIDIAQQGFEYLLLTNPYGSRISYRFVAWVTVRNRKGEYERLYEVLPNQTVEIEFNDQFILYKDGVVKITTIDLHSIPTPVVALAMQIANNA